MDQKYQIVWFFQLKGEIKHNYKTIYSVTKKPSRFINIKDIIKLYKGIRDTDIFISSFLWRRYSVLGILLSHLLRKRIIIWEEISYLHNDLRKKVKYFLMKLLAKLVNSFFVMGKLQKSILINLGIQTDLFFVANEYPGFNYNEIPAKKVNIINLNEKKLILYIGKFRRLKGIEYLIKAFNMLNKDRKDIKLLIVGEGSSETNLRKLSKENQNILIHAPIIDINEKSYLFKRSSMVVVSSIVTKNGVEGGPLVILEALSAGAPVIATTATGSSQHFILDGTNGFVVPHSDEKAIYEKMKTILDWDDKEKVKKKVLKHFEQIPNHSFQFEQMKNAIEYSLRNN